MYIVFEGVDLFEKKETDLTIVWNQIKNLEMLALYFGETKYPQNDRHPKRQISGKSSADDTPGERVWMSKTLPNHYIIAPSENLTLNEFVSTIVDG